MLAFSSASPKANVVQLCLQCVRALRKALGFGLGPYLLPAQLNCKALGLKCLYKIFRSIKNTRNDAKNTFYLFMCTLKAFINSLILAHSNCKSMHLCGQIFCQEINFQLFSLKSLQWRVVAGIFYFAPYRDMCIFQNICGRQNNHTSPQQSFCSVKTEI